MVLRCVHGWLIWSIGVRTILLHGWPRCRDHCSIIVEFWDSLFLFASSFPAYSYEWALPLMRRCQTRQSNACCAVCQCGNSSEKFSESLWISACTKHLIHRIGHLCEWSEAFSSEQVFISLAGQRLLLVNNFTHLGSTLSRSVDIGDKVSNIIAKASKLKEKKICSV